MYTVMIEGMNSGITVESVDIHTLKLWQTKGKIFGYSFNFAMKGAEESDKDLNVSGEYTLH